jgi:hypothetical protein
LVCGKRFGDGGAEHPGLDEVAKFFKNVVAGCVVGNDDGVPGDAAVSAPAVPAGVAMDPPSRTAGTMRSCSAAQSVARVAWRSILSIAFSNLFGQDAVHRRLAHAESVGTGP